MIREKVNKVTEIKIGDLMLEAELYIPQGSTAVVLFSHGSGSNRLSTRNRFVARRLQEAGIGTFLFNLLTEQEDKTYENRFDIEFLTDRLMDITRWLLLQPEAEGRNIGFFGGSTGAASALKAAARLGDSIKAVVSRGGRPDLALRELSEVSAAVQLIVGGLDQPVIGMNEVAYNHLQTARKDLVIVTGASHLFDEHGKLEEVSDLAIEWFTRYLTNQ